MIVNGCSGHTVIVNVSSGHIVIVNVCSGHIVVVSREVLDADSKSGN